MTYKKYPSRANLSATEIEATIRPNRSLNQLRESVKSARMKSIKLNTVPQFARRPIHAETYKMARDTIMLSLGQHILEKYEKFGVKKMSMDMSSAEFGNCAQSSWTSHEEVSPSASFCCYCPWITQHQSQYFFLTSKSAFSSIITVWKPYKIVLVAVLHVSYSLCGL